MECVNFIASYSLVQQPVIRNRLEDYIQEGLAQGHSIRLISPDTEVPELVKHKLFEHVSIGASNDHGSSFVKRAFAESVVAWRALKVARSYRDEHIVLTIPSMFLLFLSPLFIGKRWYLDVRDLSWEYLSEHSIFLRSVKRLFRGLARLASKRFLSVITTHETDRHFVINTLGVPSERSLLVYNGVSRKQFELLSSTEDPADIERQEEGCCGMLRPVVVSYIGNVGLAQNLVTLVRAAKLLPHVMVNIVGAGSDLDRVHDEVQSLGVDNVKLCGRVPWEEIPDFYTSSDILYAQLTSDFERAMPSKLYEYLCTGRYIVYGGGAQAQAILSRFENYKIIPPDDVGALVEALLGFDSMNNKDSASNRRLIQEEFIREDNVHHFYRYLKGS